MTTVVCSLPNPFISTSPRWEKLRFQLGTSGVFQPPPGSPVKSNDSSSAVWEPPESLEIVAEVTSDNENMRDRKVTAKFSYDLKLLADIKVSGPIQINIFINNWNKSTKFKVQNTTLKIIKLYIDSVN